MLGTLAGQVADPVPESIGPSGLVFQLEEYATIPISSGQQPRARINMLREVPDGTGRYFVNDLRGKFWVVDNGEASLYANPLVELDNFTHSPGKGTGFGAFAFHPEFATNGKLYTTHAVYPNSGTPDYSPIAHNGIALQWVLMEWTADDPSANVFDGSRRELLRLEFPTVLHGMQDIQFNPNAQAGEEDYGLLYICVGDGGSSLNGFPQNLQTPASYLGTILRIDPLGNNSPNGHYGIPADNPFIGQGDALGEVWTYGFRNPHRISWDTEGEHLMLIGDIGEKNIEELNLGLPGRNYGWGAREGTFLYDVVNGGQFQVFELPADDSLNSYTYPVAQYDHDEGLAIVGGYVYRGSALPELYGKYLFGDIPSGRVFVVDADDLAEGQMATIEEVHFVDPEGNPTALLLETGGSRADLRFGINAAGELFILTKADGKIRTLVSPLTNSNSEVAPEQVRWLFPNPGDGHFHLNLPALPADDMEISVFDLSGRMVWKRTYLNPPSSLDLSTLSDGAYWVKWQIGTTTYTQAVQLVK